MIQDLGQNAVYGANHSDLTIPVDEGISLVQMHKRPPVAKRFRTEFGVIRGEDSGIDAGRLAQRHGRGTRPFGLGRG